MRIAINAVLLSGEETGVELYIRRLIHSLAKVDQQNDYLIFTNRDTPRNEVEVGERFRVYRAGFSAGQRLRRILWEQIELPKILAREKVDLLHAPAYVMPLRSPVPCVVTMHDILAVTHPHFCKKLNVLHYGFMLPRSARRAARVIASSEATKAAIVERLQVPAEKVTVVHPGIDERFRGTSDEGRGTRDEGKGIIPRPASLAPRPPSRYILFVGRLEPKKNVTVLFQAFAWLKKNRGLPHKLVLIGPQEVLDRAVGKTMAQLGLNEAVTRMHYVSPDDLRIAYSQADVFVFPSLAEGFGFPPLEAMACGAPVVASNIAVLRETLGDAAILLPPDDPSLLAIAIHKVLTNAFLRRTLVERGLQRVRKFDWVEAARKILDVYQAVDEDQGREQTSSPRPQGGPK